MAGSDVRYTGLRTSGSWTFRSSLFTLRRTRKVSYIALPFIDAIRLAITATAYAIGELGKFPEPMFSYIEVLRAGWLTIWTILKALI